MSPFCAPSTHLAGWCLLSMWTTFVLLECPWSYSLFRLDRGVAQTVAALNQVFQPPCEPCCWSAVDRLVIKADRQTQIFTDGNVPVNNLRLLANAAHCNPEGVGGERDAPAGPLPKHPYGRQAHRSPVLLPHLGRP